MKMDWVVLIIPTPQDGKIAACVCQIANKTGASRQGPPEFQGSPCVQMGKWKI